MTKTTLITSNSTHNSDIDTDGIQNDNSKQETITVGSAIHLNDTKDESQLFTRFSPIIGLRSYT